jgi:hypothetical protein
MKGVKGAKQALALALDTMRKTAKLTKWLVKYEKY